ncbi:hypothetical protein BpHYR1_012339 [Brachionus plicatilis]|uniref:Uncharacterized protein n=1 Tax=Brachionus plicatilis TaxID=10195 RepID=A0A3M7PU59_BRAPC|nr:hypothetical protein BpHYR1_012339 [Brachionus plicatilis]
MSFLFRLYQEHLAQLSPNNCPKHTDVASSNRRILGCLSKARAIATQYFRQTLNSVIDISRLSNLYNFVYINIFFIYFTIAYIFSDAQFNEKDDI